MTTEARGDTFLPGTGRNESLSRAFELLEVMARSEGGASVAHLAKATDLPRTTVARLLASLFDVGAAARPGDARRWVIGPAIIRLSRSGHQTTALKDLARPVLLELAQRFREAALLAVPIGPAAVRVLDQVPCPRIVGATEPWSELAITSPASGAVRLLLAEMSSSDARKALGTMARTKHTPHTKTSVDDLMAAVDQVRAEGHSTVVDEYEEGLAGVGVAVRSDGELIGMLSIYLPTSRLPEAQAAGVVDQLNVSARLLTSSKK